MIYGTFNGRTFTAVNKSELVLNRLRVELLLDRLSRDRYKVQTLDKVTSLV